MADENFSIIEDLQENLRTAKFPLDNLSTIAQKGDKRPLLERLDAKLVQQFLTENVQIHGTGPQALQSQLYVACFWGFRDLVRQLLERGIDVNAQNARTKWTPLHAATFQEHGPVVMMLLDQGARPDSRDSEGRTPKDFASASDKIWMHFAARNLRRTPRNELVSLGILHMVEKDSAPCVSPRHPGEGIQMADNHNQNDDSLHSDPYLNAAMNGDVLAQDQSSSQGGGNPQFSLWK